MSVGLCLITHDRIGEALLDTATAMLGGRPLPTAIVPVTSVCGPERADELLRRARATVHAIDEGEGVIVLTDLFGSTPSNIAASLGGGDGRVVVIAGVNLPMLVRLMNYPGLGLEQLAEKAVSGGREGIFRCDDDT